MTPGPKKPTPAAWLLSPKRALAREVGVDPRSARRLLARARRRRWPWAVAVVALQIAFMIGWIGLVSSTVGIYESTTTFTPQGVMVRETTTGPFGITTFPLFFGLLLGPCMALVLGAASGLAAHGWLVDREARRCARTPACFGCGYDLSGVAGPRCPECGQPHPVLAARSGDAARTVRP